MMKHVLDVVTVADDEAGLCVNPFSLTSKERLRSSRLDLICSSTQKEKHRLLWSEKAEILSIRL